MPSLIESQDVLTVRGLAVHGIWMAPELIKVTQAGERWEDP